MFCAAGAQNLAQLRRRGTLWQETSVKFLFDTNIIIPLEPQVAPTDGAIAPAAMELLRLIQQSGSQVLVHELISDDIQRDRQEERKRWTSVVLAKYPVLSPYPGIAPEQKLLIGDAPRGSNAWVDDHLLTAVARDAVDYLVTEDRGMHRKAARLAIGERVLFVIDALTIVRGLFPAFSPTPPAVARVPLHSLDASDPIFDGFRSDYLGTFDAWLSNAKRLDRPAWVVWGDSHRIAALCIIKEETSGEFGLRGKVLKICTFKVADQYHGFRFGELLLKPVFRYLVDNKYDRVFVTSFEKHVHLVAMFADFGFRTLEERTSLGELVLERSVGPQGDDVDLGPAEFCLRFSPLFPSWKGTVWLVPIRPVFEAILFPERQTQGDFFGGTHPFGNGIRKAYLCHSGTTSLAAGDVLAFYRSVDTQAVVSLGTVDSVMRSEVSNEITRFVARRTVYTASQIDHMCLEGAVLAIQFRQLLRDFEPIPGKELKKKGISTPQSLARLTPEALPWFRQRTGT